MSNSEMITTNKSDVEKTRTVHSVTPLVDIFENEEEILLHAEMPGVLKENVTVNIDNGRLTISAIRKLEAKGSASWQEFGDVEFLRAFSVPQTIDVGKVNAELKDGVLHLHLPKSEAARPKQIEIKTG